MGEHSPVDALVPSIVADYAVVQEIDGNAFDSDPSGTHFPTSLENVGCKRLDWVVDGHIRKQCAAAEDRARAIVDDSDDSVLWFDGYGTEWIKNSGRYRA